MSKRDLIIFITLALLWSISFVLYRVGVPEFGAVVFACLRMLFAGLTMVVFLLLNPASRQGIRAHYKLLTVIGVLSTAVPFMLFAFAAQSINAGVLAVINASVPVMSGFIASMFFNEKLSRKQVVGLLIGIAGVAILMSDRLFAGVSNNTGFISSVLPLGYALLGGAGYAIGANLTKGYLQSMSPLAITAGSLVIASALMLPLGIYQFPYGKDISLIAWTSVVGVGVFSTAIALIFMNQLIKSIGTMRATSITLVTPIFAIILGYLLLGEALNAMAILGSVVILIGTYLSLNLSFKKRRQRHNDFNNDLIH